MSNTLQQILTTTFSNYLGSLLSILDKSSECVVKWHKHHFIVGFFFLPHFLHKFIEIITTGSVNKITQYNSSINLYIYDIHCGLCSLL